MGASQIQKFRCPWHYIERRGGSTGPVVELVNVTVLPVGYKHIYHSINGFLFKKHMLGLQRRY